MSTQSIVSVPDPDPGLSGYRERLYADCSEYAWDVIDLHRQEVGRDLDDLGFALVMAMDGKPEELVRIYRGSVDWFSARYGHKLEEGCSVCDIVEELASEQAGYMERQKRLLVDDFRKEATRLWRKAVMEAEDLSQQRFDNLKSLTRANVEQLAVYLHHELSWL